MCLSEQPITNLVCLDKHSTASIHALNYNEINEFLNNKNYNKNYNRI
jgi:hypothetical protein